ncbi:MAG: GNAT family N-acetyltransferase, partial [Rhodanobacter sp.]
AWRRQGIGTAILRELVARASALGMQQVILDAPDSALELCRSAGFTASPADAGGPGARRHALHLPTAQRSVEAPPLRDLGSLAAGSRSEVAAARLQLLADTRHQLLIYVPALSDDIFSNAAELEQLRRIGCSGRSASIRMLLHDPAAAVVNDHPLLPLAQRLPTAFQIRTPTEPVDLTYASSYLLNDSGGYLFQPDASRPAGRAARNHRTAQAPLRQHFSEAWERAERAAILNTLDL